MAERLASEPLFAPTFRWTEALQAELRTAGHVVLPGVLTTAASAALVETRDAINSGGPGRGRPGPRPLASQLHRIPTHFLLNLHVI